MTKFASQVDTIDSTTFTHQINRKLNNQLRKNPTMGKFLFWVLGKSVGLLASGCPWRQVRFADKQIKEQF